MTYYAQKRGNVAHTHSYRVIALTLDGPLKVLFSCRGCGNTEIGTTISKKKVLPGVPEQFWSRLGSVRTDPKAEEGLRADLLKELELRMTAAGAPRGALAD